MGHPRVENATPLAFEPVFLNDEEGRPILVTLCKATFNLGDDQLTLADEQLPPDFPGTPRGSPDESSYIYEPEIAFFKPSTDVVLIGSARSWGKQSVVVGIKVGQVQKIVKVFGDRYWVKQDGRVFATKPAPFEAIPLVYERAFGGWDKADKDEANWRYEPSNPVGVGFGDPLRFVEEGKVMMPNIEDPQHLIRHYRDRPPPAGLGFISPNWEPRVQYAGTYDEKWDKTRKPLLPDDFDRRFFNAASPGLIAPAYLRGDEDVMVVNASPVPKLKFNLPGIAPPVCTVGLNNGGIKELHTNLDTVIVNTDEMLVFLLWRSYIVIPSGPHDIATIDVTIAGVA